MTELPEPTSHQDPGAEPSEFDNIAGDDETALDMAAVRRLRSENARWRHLLREEQANRADTASQLEAAATRLLAYQRREVEREAAAVLHDPADVWRTDPDTQQSWFDSEFGEVVADRVVESAKALAASKPHLGKPSSGSPPSDRPVEGLRSGAGAEEKPPPATWFSAIRGG